MSESKAVVSSAWSALTTVDDFDKGIKRSNGSSIKTTKNISSNIVISLFIESLIDELCKLVEKEPLKRLKLYRRICSKLYEMQIIENTYNIEELAPLRGYYQQALLNVMLLSDTRYCSPPLFGSSRYAAEYEEICFISSGGFGKVYKAKNKLDQVIYAVKKIPLRYQSLPTFERKLSEVKTLAKLNHPNIVHYKAAWLEPLFDTTPSLPPSDFSEKSSNDSDVVIFEHNDSDSKNKKNYQSLEESENDKSLVLCKFSENFAIKKPIPQISALLYVTMQLCDETLYDWLVQRNLNKSIDVSLALHIMTEAATGVKYIHSCNIVHHDIKPRNIFLSQDLKSIEVGDFGLSCCLQGHNSSCLLEGGKFGTPLYAAPEQLKGLCDSKSDLFSLGLIFIELLTIFSTEMERVEVLNASRSGLLPSSIPLILVPLIKSLLSHHPTKRPTAEELVKSLQELKQFKSSITTTDKGTTTETNFSFEEISKAQEAENIIKDKDKEIIELRQKLIQKENEIAHLKQLINKSFFLK